MLPYELRNSYIRMCRKIEHLDLHKMLEKKVPKILSHISHMVVSYDESHGAK